LYPTNLSHRGTAIYKLVSKSDSTTRLVKKDYQSVVFIQHKISPISRTVIESCVITQRDSSEYLQHTQHCTPATDTVTHRQLWRANNGLQYTPCYELTTCGWYVFSHARPSTWNSTSV